MQDLMTIDEVRHHFAYNAETGRLIWLVPRANRVKAGVEVGWVNNEGYRVFEFKEKQYKVHRVAWFYMTGQWPKNEIDHINGVRADNRFSNLREATKSENQRNRKIRSNKAVKFKGVSRQGNGYQVSVDRKYKGFYKSAQEAHAVYCRESRKIFGKFARDG